MKLKKNKNKKIIIIAVLVTVLLSAGVGAYFYSQDQSEKNKPDSDSTKSTSNSGKIKTKQKSSEDAEFPVPDNVPDSSIKNYTLITENEQYKIRREDGTNKYLITLYPIVNNAQQYSTYDDQLREYKQNALDYLKSQGKDITKLDATYEPEEANRL